MNDLQTILAIATVLIAVLALGVSVGNWLFPDIRHWLFRKVRLGQAVASSERDPQSAFPERPKADSPNQEVPAKTQCPLCKGSGNAWNFYSETCKKCNGFGYIYTFRVGQPNCPPCKGTGRKNATYAEQCPVCDGVGLLPFDSDDKDHLLSQPGA